MIIVLSHLSKPLSITIKHPSNSSLPRAGDDTLSPELEPRLVANLTSDQSLSAVVV